MKFIHIAISVLYITWLTGCSGEDRSSEQPLAPTVRIISATPQNKKILLKGEVLTSPNSSLTKCGFKYGAIGSQEKTITADSISVFFHALTDSLESGRYYAVAYATNLVGTNDSDTLYFTKE